MRSARSLMPSKPKPSEDEIDLLHKSEKGEAFADKNPDFTDKSGRKCFALQLKIDFCKRSIFV
jgi:hypothetical protein